MRLQKYIAQCGYASRRKAEQLIIDGRVTVNGVVVTEMGVKVDAGDIVKVDDKRIKTEKRKVYILLNKPIGVVTTSDDEFDRKTVLDLLEGIKERVYPVGRLDYNTAGLLILTNDGELTKFLTHPSHEIEKTYIAEFYGNFDETKKQIFEKGVDIEGYQTLPAKVEILSPEKVKVTIREGKNRQIRKMFEQVECDVYKLRRISIGTLHDDKLMPGKWRYLKAEELKGLGYVTEE
ncbi:MAG: rRNA pseudouridine synthase [Clostridia bacterium]|nr:rRNA pseudouridine synthase [Clostridia bacterium]